MNRIRVKICGLRHQMNIHAATQAGAAYIGFVFFADSPRYVNINQARNLAQDIPVGICKTALVVDPSDAELDQIINRVPIDMIQLHGKESVERVGELRKKYGLPVMKAIGISSQEDLYKITEYGRVCDQLLIDAKPAKEANLPGGNGVSFDWRLIAGRRWPVPWMLAGGLNSDNVRTAIAMTGAQQIDVSSGVECASGVKDNNMIADFIRVANGEQ